MDSAEPRADEAPAPTVTPPRVAAPVRTPVVAFFTLVAGALRRPGFHPRGMALAGTMTRLPAGDAALPFPADETVPVVGRLSRAVGLPRWLPDLHGLGLRIPDAYGHGQHQDVLVTSCGRRRRTRRLLCPTSGFDRRPYSSVLSYDRDGTRLLLGARYAGPKGGLRPPCDPSRARRSAALGIDGVAQAAAVGELRFDLAYAMPGRPWRPFATVTFDRVVPEAPMLNPWNTFPTLRPIGRINALRDPAYRASQRARLWVTGVRAWRV